VCIPKGTPFRDSACFELSCVKNPPTDHFSIGEPGKSTYEKTWPYITRIFPDAPLRLIYTNFGLRVRLVDALWHLVSRCIAIILIVITIAIILCYCQLSNIAHFAQCLQCVLFRLQTVKLRFPFLFYGHEVNNITITTGGRACIRCPYVAYCNMNFYVCTIAMHIKPSCACRLQGGPNKRIPSFIFGITSVIQHRF